MRDAQSGSVCFVGEREDVSWKTEEDEREYL